MGPVVAVVLAAGASSRFGANKLLAPFGGEPLVRRTIRNVLAAGVGEVVVVVGRDAERVRAALTGLPVRCVENARYRDGMSTSLRAGVRAVGRDAAGLLVALGDQPSVTPAVIGRIVDAYRRTGKAIVAPLYDGVRGNPVLFDARLRPELLAVRGDVGARRVVERVPERVETVAFDFPPPPDVDTPEDLAALHRRSAAPSGPGAEA